MNETCNAICASLNIKPFAVGVKSCKFGLLDASVSFKEHDYTITRENKRWVSYKTNHQIVLPLHCVLPSLGSQ